MFNLFKKKLTKKWNWKNKQYCYDPNGVLFFLIKKKNYFE